MHGAPDWASYLPLGTSETPQEPWDLTGTCKRVTAEEGALIHMAEGLLGHAAGAPATTQSTTALPPAVGLESKAALMLPD